MMDKHISESEIQQYVLEPGSAAPSLKRHLEQCAACREKASQYELTFAAIQTLPKPSFDFDVAELVLAQLPEQPRPRISRVPAIILGVLIAAVLVCLPFFLFGFRLSLLWKSASPWLIGLVVMASAACLLINLIDMYNRYKRLIRQVNFQ